jgi:hypothetical protein
VCVCVCVCVCDRLIFCRVGSGLVRHVRIMTASSAVHLEGSERQFPTLSALVAHYAKKSAAVFSSN